MTRHAAGSDIVPLLAELRAHIGPRPEVDAIEADVRRAIAVSSFLARAETGEPFHRVSFGSVPVTATGAMFPALREAVKTRHPIFAKVHDALDEMQRTYITHADAQEYIDALGTSSQYLHAAGYLDAAAEKLLRLMASG